MNEMKEIELLFFFMQTYQQGGVGTPAVPYYPQTSGTLMIK